MDSEIVYNAKGEAVSFNGPDAVELYRVRTLASMVRLHAKTGIIPTRGVTITKMFKLAERYTGKKYKRGQHEQVIADLDIWANNMQSALPLRTR